MALFIPAHADARENRSVHRHWFGGFVHYAEPRRHLWVWFVSRKASDVALKMFGVVEIGVGVADAGVGRVDDLIATSRTEVRQAAETISAVGGQTVANSAVLTALNERLETNLAPRIAQMQQALAPVRDALGKVSNAVSMVSALPGMAERAPRLAALDEALNRIEIGRASCRERV